nr:hypothetical protein [Bacillus pumilus]
MQKNQQINAFEESFSKEIIDIIAVTGPSGVGADKESLWTASIPLIAWKENGHLTTEKTKAN